MVQSCYHCSEMCEEEVLFDGKVFCCEGCKTVYDILKINDMAEYYAMNERPGVKAKGDSKRYDFLDLQEVADKLFLFSEGEISRVKLYLPQIHCSSCLWLLENIRQLNPAIISSNVHFSNKEAEITFNHNELSLRELAKLLWSIGYPPDISLASVEKPANQRKNQRLILQIGVVGFCFGNIMLMSFPEYLGLDESFSNFQHTFGYLNLILSIPVLIFGARDYIVSSFRALQHKTVNMDVPITLGIFALYSRSLYEVLSGNGAGYFDSFAGLIFFLLIGKWFQQKTYSAINFDRDYKSYFPIATTKIVNNEHKITSLKDVDVGDQLFIRNNELIPVDAQLISTDAHIDYSFVSGESTLIHKKKGDHLFAGGKQMGNGIAIEVKKSVDNSYLTSLWNNSIFSKEKVHSKLSDIVSKYFTVAVILIAVLAGVYWYINDPSQAAFVVSAVLIVACPCAIALSVPFTYGNVIRKLAKKSFYLRSADVVEPMTSITDIVFDKTGTMTLSDEVDIHWQGKQLSEADRSIIRSVTNQSSHPLSKSITKFLHDSKMITDVFKIKEIAGKGIEAEIRNNKWRIGSADWLGTENDLLQTNVYVEKEGEILGKFTFQNNYREGIFNTINHLKDKYSIHLLSGDGESEKKKLQAELGEDVAMYFMQSPQQKLEYIQQLQDQGKKVMIFGDGLNDAGALKSADVGIAVVDDIYSFSPSSDGIIQGNKLTEIDHFIAYSHYAKSVVIASYVFSLFYNVAGLYFALTAQLTPLVAAILMPLSSISVVALVTALTSLRATKID